MKGNTHMCLSCRPLTWSTLKWARSVPQLPQTLDPMISCVLAASSAVTNREVSNSNTSTEGLTAAATPPVQLQPAPASGQCGNWLAARAAGAKEAANAKRQKAHHKRVKKLVREVKAQRAKPLLFPNADHTKKWHTAMNEAALELLDSGKHDDLISFQGNKVKKGPLKEKAEALVRQTFPRVIQDGESVRLLPAKNAHAASPPPIPPHLPHPGWLR